jgi:Holliday junction resolvasome RuvABC endonuclease subunit
MNESQIRYKQANDTGNLIAVKNTIITQQAEEIQRLHNLVESLNAIIEEEMGEWYGVEYAYLPVSLSNIAHMRDAIQAELAKDEQS